MQLRRALAVDRTKETATSTVTRWRCCLKCCGRKGGVDKDRETVQRRTAAAAVVVGVEWELWAALNGWGAFGKESVL